MLLVGCSAQVFAPTTVEVTDDRVTRVVRETWRQWCPELRRHGERETVERYTARYEADGSLMSSGARQVLVELLTDCLPD